MKTLFTTLLLTICLQLSAQWSNTTNQFYDSLHMPVCTAAGDQLKSLVVRSYPDSGYFLIWEDHRRGFYEKFQIFAQKYDKTGKQLWANDGVAISAGTNSQHYTYSTNNDYRNYSIAATDSAGGFYISYADDSISNYVWERLTVQHVRNNGTTVFPGIGAVLFTSDQANQNLAPQLIADGNGGFFVSHLHAGYGTMDLFVYCYKDINGSIKAYGGGLVNENGVQIDNVGYCGHYPTVSDPQTFVIDYNIYSDLQKGCNVVMTFSQNGGLPNTNNRLQVAFNWLWRVKKDTKTSTANFSKDDVLMFYKFRVQNGLVTCKDSTNGNTYNYPTSKLISKGFFQISDWVYGSERTKGALLQTDGNINVNCFTANQRDVTGNAVSDWFTRGYFRNQQKFDSIPFEYTAAPYLPNSFVSVNIPGQNKLGSSNGKLNDTLLYNTGSSYFYDYSLASGGNKLFATAIIGSGIRNVLLQQMSVQRISADSFAINVNTANNKGIVIGKELSTGFSGTEINYNKPQVLADNKGNGLFYILEIGRSTRVSPIFKGAELAWGAMGKPTGTGHSNGYYYPDLPNVSLDPLYGTGLLSWNDERTPPGNGQNIFMRHLDDLNNVGYFPPNYLVKKLLNANSATTANPIVLTGSSKKYSAIDAYSTYSGVDVTTPVVEILDNYNLGSVSVSVFENVGDIRKYNGHPYLDRNYTITPENNPGGAATINVRLYFTEAEFNALKAADPGITSPGDLAVVKQPATGTAPSSYIFVAGETAVYPQSWAAVPGGYYIEIAINNFSNFFIQKANGGLPLQWLDVQASWVNKQAKINWQVANEVNVKEYNVQQSADGIHFINGCNVIANKTGNYTCTLTAKMDAMNYYRVQQIDMDGKSNFSKIVTLESLLKGTITIYPNPAKDHLFIMNNLNYRNLVITDLGGKIVLNKSIPGGLNKIQISQLPAGTYFIRLSNGAETETLKFVKE
ncbi:MAG: T9SS type A sorting domain-containing protein [Ginsengibacter sp.]